MPHNVTLLTSRDAMHSLHELVETKKQSVKVDRDVLADLLIDHVRLYQVARMVSEIKIEEPPEGRSRIRIQA